MDGLRKLRTISSTTSYYDMIRNFMEVGRQGEGTLDTPMEKAIFELRTRIIKEEAKELLDKMKIYEKAPSLENLVGVADNMVDLCYVVIGTAVAQGIPFDRIFELVHTFNMQKFPIHRECEGKGCEWTDAGETELHDGTKKFCIHHCSFGRVVILDSGGKVMKPKGWIGPEEQIWKILFGKLTHDKDAAMQPVAGAYPKVL